MRIKWHTEAKKDLQQFQTEIQEEIASHITRLDQNPLGENTSLLNKQGLEIFRLKLKNKELDHRVFFDLNDGEVIILGIEHRDNAYTPESIEKIKSRK